MKRISGSRSKIGIVVFGALVLASCGGGGNSSAGDTSGGDSLSVELSEFSVAVSPATVDSGETTFSVKNVGGATHEFVVVKTDLADGDLPTAKDGSVDEEGGGLEAVDEIEDMKPGTSGELTVQLDPGNYVLFCNVVEGDQIHYKEGMHTAFTVK